MRRFAQIAALALAIAGLADTARAWDQVGGELCGEAWEKFALLMSRGDADHPSLAVQPLAVGGEWCIISAPEKDVENPTLEQIRWRAEDLTRWVEQDLPPLALHIQFVGLAPDRLQNSAPTDRPKYDLDVVLRQQPEAGLVIVEEVLMNNQAGDELLASAVFERVFLTSPSMVQVSTGSIAFKAGLVSITYGGAFENPFGFDIQAEMGGAPDELRERMNALITALPDGVSDGESRAQLSTFAAQLPRPVGRLELQINSSRGLGLMQLAIAVVRGLLDPVGEAPSTDHIRALELLFDGVTLRADWGPAERVSD